VNGYMYPEWGDVDTQSHEARMERLRDWQQEYLDAQWAEELGHFTAWERELGPLFRDWLVLLDA